MTGILYINKKSFDECIKEAKRNKNSILFIPHIHNLSKELMSSSEWLTLKENQFYLPNPPLYLVQGLSVLDKSCCCLETLSYLVVDENFVLVDALNTQDAALKVSLGEVSFGVTNEYGQKNIIYIL